MTGWITNNGKILECEPYEHLKIDDPIIKGVWEEYEWEVQSALDYCTSLEEAEEHPEWHTYEMCVSSCESQAYRDLYKKGYLRVAQYLNGDHSVEGFASSIESLKHVIKKISEDYNCKIKTFFVDDSRKF